MFGVVLQIKVNLQIGIVPINYSLFFSLRMYM